MAEGVLAPGQYFSRLDSGHYLAVRSRQAANRLVQIKITDTGHRSVTSTSIPNQLITTQPLATIGSRWEMQRMRGLFFETELK